MSAEGSACSIIAQAKAWGYIKGWPEGDTVENEKIFPPVDVRARRHGHGAEHRGGRLDELLGLLEARFLDAHVGALGDVPRNGVFVAVGVEDLAWGVKKFGGEVVRTGMILVRQRGTVMHPGQNVGLGKDDTLFALADGKVQFTRFGKTRKKVHVLPVPAEAS